MAKSPGSRSGVSKVISAMNCSPKVSGRTLVSGKMSDFTSTLSQLLRTRVFQALISKAFW